MVWPISASYSDLHSVLNNLGVSSETTPLTLQLRLQVYMAETEIRIWFSSSLVFNHNPSFSKSPSAIPSGGLLRDVFANRIFVLWPDLNLRIFNSLGPADELELRVNLFPIKNTLVPSYVRSVHYWLHRGASCKILWGPLSQRGLVFQASCSALRFLSFTFLFLLYFEMRRV